MKKTISSSSAQANAQVAALSHQLHLQSIQTLTTLLAVPNISEELKSSLEKSLLSLLEPFLPQTPIIK